MFREARENFGRSSSGEKHDHTVWAVEALECPNTQVQAGCLRSATGHLFEHVMATYHPPGIAGDASGQ